MRVAIYHDLPRAGGAPTVLAEYLWRARGRHRFVLYTPQTDDSGFIDFDALVERTERHPHAGGGPGPVGVYRRLASVPRTGRRIAAAIDAAGHDAAFVLPSVLVQAPEVLPYLRTPSLYYAPEPLRAEYEPSPAIEPPGALARLRARVSPYNVFRRRLDRRDIAAATRVMTHSRFTADALRRIYGVESEVVRLGVDSERFAPDDTPREGFVLSVGALDPAKGHQFVIEAVAALPEPRPRLVVLGDRGGYEGDLRALAARRGVALDVRRALPPDEVVALYRRAGTLACGAYREPFGLTPLEAMATCTPVVAVAEGGFRETVDDGRTGLLVPRDAGAFGVALARVLGDRALAEQLGTAGRSVVTERWSWDQTAEAIDALLERTAAAASP